MGKQAQIVGEVLPEFDAIDRNRNWEAKIVQSGKPYVDCNETLEQLH